MTSAEIPYSFSNAEPFLIALAIQSFPNSFSNAESLLIALVMQNPF